MYQLHPENELLEVNTIVHMTGIQFEAAAGPRVALRHGRGYERVHSLN